MSEKDNFDSFLATGIKNKKLKPKELYEKVELAKKGDQAAYEDILGHLHTYLCRITKEFYFQGAEAQDVYQEGAIKLVNVIEKFDKDKSTFIQFAQSSIRKHIITTMNKENAKKRIVLNQSFSLDDSSNREEGDSGEYNSVIESKIDKDTSNLVSEIGNPLDLVQRDYEEYLVDQISEVLSDLEKKVFYLRFMKYYSYKETAKELGLYRKSGSRMILDQKAVDNAIWRSRPKIKKVMERLNIKSRELDKILDEEEVREKKTKKVAKKTKKAVKKVKKIAKKVVKKNTKKAVKQVKKAVKKTVVVVQKEKPKTHIKKSPLKKIVVKKKEKK